jgi:hypothetical protein
MSGTQTVMPAGRLRPVSKFATINDGSGCKTQKSKAKDCDINRIVAKYRKTGILGDPAHTRKPFFADVVLKGNYHAMQNMLTAADRAFMSLPAALRARFGNNPAAAYDFISKAENTKAAVEMGLLPKSAIKSVKSNDDPSNPNKTKKVPNPDAAPALNSDPQPEANNEAKNEPAAQ